MSSAAPGDLQAADPADAPRSGGTAVVLSGGGAKAAYQIGVLQALLEGSSPSTGHRPLDARIYTGTSAGAFNAAHLVSHAHEGPAAARRLAEVWLQRIARPRPILGNGVFRLRAAPLAVFDAPARPGLRELLDVTGRDAAFWLRELLVRGEALGRQAGPLTNRLLDNFDLSALFSTEPFRRLVHETIDLEGLARAPQQLQLVAADWASGQPRLFTKAEIAGPAGADAILASAAIPGIFSPVMIGGRAYVDGSLVMATPLGPAIGAGAETLHVIYLDAEASTGPPPPLANTIDTVSRVFLYAVAGRVNSDIESAAAINREVQLVADLEALGLDLHRHSEAVSLLSPHSRVLRRVRQGRPYRQLTIHRYRLRHDRGGSESLLDFDPDYVRHLIRTGFRDAADHDCRAEGCVLPEPCSLGGACPEKTDRPFHPPPEGHGERAIEPPEAHREAPAEIDSDPVH